MGTRVRFVGRVVCFIVLADCSFPRPADVVEIDASAPGIDAPAQTLDAGIDGPQTSVCTPNRSLRCDGDTLVRCNGDGTSELRETCSLGCNLVAVRCNDVDPSNGLATYLDMAASEPDVDFGAMAVVNTDEGTVTVDGQPIAVNHARFAQTRAEYPGGDRA